MTEKVTYMSVLDRTGPKFSLFVPFLGKNPPIQESIYILRVLYPYAGEFKLSGPKCLVAVNSPKYCLSKRFVICLNAHVMHG
jgi:hypothetical protein